MKKRQAATGETRTRILEAARQLLSSEAETDLSMESMARQADVSRLTIYYQFGSRSGLLEALYDYLAERGDIRRMGEVFHEPDSSVAIEIDTLVSIFVGFWSSDPVAIRRLRAMSALDPAIARGIGARDARRRHIAAQVLKRIAGVRKKRLPEEQLGTRADLLSMLTSFATYDALAAAGHSPQDIIALIARLAHSVAG
jgi:AcrR family transcriptional regulator